MTAVVPVAIGLAWQIRFLDTPLAHKAHVRPTPYLGGAAVIAATVPVAILLGGVNSALAWIVGGTHAD